MWERFVRTLVFVALAVSPGRGEVRFLGPTPYREFSDSPCLDQSLLGFLPTCIGLVVTDGIYPNFISLTAFDAVGSQFNILTSDVMLSSLDNGDTSEDRFMGAWSADGIRELRITHTYASVLFARRFEIDHVQYFYNNVPENFGNTTIHALAFLAVWVFYSSSAEKRRFQHHPPDALRIEPTQFDPM